MVMKRLYTDNFIFLNMNNYSNLHPLLTTQYLLVVKRIKNLLKCDK